MKIKTRNLLTIHRKNKIPLRIYIYPELLRLVFFILPIGLAAIVFISLWTWRQSSLVLKNSEKISNKELVASQTENLKLKEQIESLNKLQDEMKKKLIGSTGKTGNFNLFSPSLGFSDLTTKEFIKIENIRNKVEDSSYKLEFDLVNSNPNAARVSGYIFILLYSRGDIQIFPDTANFNEGLKLEFYRGESFGISRFRPVIARFGIPKNTKDSFYKIFVFSQTGDLVLESKYGPVSTVSGN